MIRLKQTVRPFGLRPELVLAAVIVEGAFRNERLDTVITSAIDGIHSPRSLHYTGSAIDIRIHHVPVERREALVGEIRDALGPDFQVLWEAAGTDNEHLHIAFRPIAPY